MNKLWLICLIIRSLLIYYIYNYWKYDKGLIKYILIIIGIGFLYKGYTGSNNEYQISKVFWHKTRYIHSMFYLLALLSYIYNKKNICIIMLLFDIIFSIIYRLITNQ